MWHARIVKTGIKGTVADNNDKREQKSQYNQISEDNACIMFCYIQSITQERTRNRLKQIIWLMTPWGE